MNKRVTHKIRIVVLVHSVTAWRSDLCLFRR